MAARCAWLLVAVLAACVGSAVSDSECGGYACPEYDVIDVLHGDVEIRRYKSGMWVKYPVPGDDFIFMAEYGDEKLSGYFAGENYEHKEVAVSSPLKVDFNVWNLGEQRYAAYWLPEAEESLPPAAVPPARVDKHGEKFIFVKKYNATHDFRAVLKEVASGMVDLTIDGSPFDLNEVSIAMYDYPKGGSGERQEDEIWYTRTFKHWDSPDVPVLREIAEKFRRAF
ncbi:unnamed protein product [Ostreobium quekettii]|uniref:Uncharacterized protein n=1 Tax=Ostreobium quekettii TaxID=121088 RepID=A0A8S1J5T3_9CHLO|nr:unnamed protein product [Ostreobium quekettii]